MERRMVVNLDSRRAHHWEEAILGFAIVFVFLCFVALFTPYLSGPLFNPLALLLGVYVIYVTGLLLAGGARDEVAFED